MQFKRIAGVVIINSVDCDCSSSFDIDLQDMTYRPSVSDIICTCPVCGKKHVVVYPANVSKLPHSFLMNVKGYGDAQGIMTWHE